MMVIFPVSVNVTQVCVESWRSRIILRESRRVKCVVTSHITTTAQQQWAVAVAVVFPL